MLKDNVVVFKGKKDSILVLLDSEIPFEELKESLRVKAQDASKFFGGAKSAIRFSGRTITEEEELELISIIMEQANLNISYVEDSPRQPAKKIPPAAAEAVQKALYMPEHMAAFHHGSLRNGQSIRYPGSVIIIGDINPGAEIIAEGNIIVLGTVKGILRAGCMGSTESFIFAMNLSPTQLRIAEIATYIPEDMLKKNKKKPIPSYAYIENGQIYISPVI